MYSQYKCSKLNIFKEKKKLFRGMECYTNKNANNKHVNGHVENDGDIF